MEPTTFVLFGATGDLAKRKIYPALYNLFIDEKLPQSFSVVGLGRREWTDEFFQSNVEQSLHNFSRREAGDHEKLKQFVQKFRYCVLNIDHIEDYKKLLQMIEQREQQLGLAPNRLFYLSVGPEYFETIAANILASGLGSADGWKRLVIEKPFGHDLESARHLNRQLSKTFAEQEIFRIDHYLGKPVVQQLNQLREHAPLVREIWQPGAVANVQITANETVGVEERAGYYDHVGAARDMFQNHMLQLLMMLAVHLPGGQEDVHVRKTNVMKALKPVRHEAISESVVRGQYGAGEINGAQVAGYTSEPGISAESTNDTFIAARLEIDNEDWCGVPFYIRTGKRLKEKSTRMVVEFKEALPLDGSPNLLVFEMSPGEGISLQAQHADGRQLALLELTAQQSGAPEAYENLIHDALGGDHTFFAHWNEVELPWEWVQPVLDAFAGNTVPLHAYKAGTYGPAASDALLTKDGFHWWFDDRKDSSASKIQTKEGEQYAYNTNYRAVSN
ncbi:glucose-6-phosphate dehydrogenase [Paenibacillus sp. GCM10027626]|uniref:glucose-6-phosphate dehydrogenase n=1 Tax=Paenibacillus sp. GCM10027626 TaxID=3273411 RepID=UPI0036458250